MYDFLRPARRIFHWLRGEPGAATPQPSPVPRVVDVYVKTVPSAQNAIDIFKGEWSSMLPPTPWGNTRGGILPLFVDERVHWAIAQFGGVQDFRVLELGPLEAAHTYILEKAGASVQAVESHPRAFLRCLVVKELLGLKNASFACGDFVEYLKGTDRQFDAIVASGVLYHMRDPLEVLALLASHTERVFVWTHYYDEALVQGNDKIRSKFRQHTQAACRGFTYTSHLQEYQAALDRTDFCGGADVDSVWLERQDILDALTHFGFRDIRIGEEKRDNPHGPAFCLTAMK